MPLAPPGLSLYRWQGQALLAWQQQAYRGVVEAVTGAGKTHVGLAAIAQHLGEGWRVVVLVPSVHLLNQWVDKIKRHLKGDCGLSFRVGRLGDGCAASLMQCDVLVSIAQSAYRRELNSDRQRTLLIADECHRYGAEKWSLALESGFERRLGLTATYERDDEGSETLDRFFNGICKSVNYEEALSEDIIAHFKIALIGVRFSDEEMNRYNYLDRQARQFRKALCSRFDVPAAPFGDFMRAVNRLRKSAATGDGASLAGKYLQVFNQRRQLLAGASAKLERMADLNDAVARAERTILFAQTTKTAEEAVRRLSQRGIHGEVLCAAMDQDERDRVFQRFQNGTLKAVVAPLLLDEGVDIPEVDLAIVLAASRTRRQMVQRMGRILRKKEDDRLARLAVLFVEATSEDPAQGAHEDFLQYVIKDADAVESFSPATRPRTICSYLNDWFRS